MLKVKNNAKFMLVFGIMLVAMFIFNTNTVNAVEPTQEMLDLIPNEINLDISEMECVETDTKAQKLIEQKIKEIYQQNSIDTNEMQIHVYGARFIEGDIRTADIRIANKNGGNPKSKKVSVVYSNTNQKNATDEQYVKNLMDKLKSPKYYEVDLDFCSDNTTNFDDVWNEQFRIITNYYTKQINDNTITVKTSAGAGGTDGGLNVWTWEGRGTIVGLFKNGILYGIKAMGMELTVPVINVPNTVAKNEVKDYVINLIKENHREFGEDITNIEKGTKNKSDEYGINIDIPNGYTIYAKSDYGTMTSYVIINGIDNIEDTNTNNDNNVKPVTVTDNKTNIKLETNDGVVPSNTVLEVQPITEGKIFDNVKKVLSNVNKFKAFDITLKSNGVEIQPNGKVKISIPIPQDFDTSKLMVYRVEENGQKIAYKVNVVTIDNIKYAQFETDHFSTYVLAETDPNSNEKDNTPKTGIETNTMPYVLGIVATIGIAFIIKRK